MLIQINYQSGQSPYLQIVEQIKNAAASGIIRSGETLPSIRPLAEKLRINRNTVAKAYAELEREGVIETVSGKGCFLSKNQSPYKKAVRKKIVEGSIDGAIVKAFHLQVEEEEFMKIAETRWKYFKKENKS
ncbi:MAG TPA: GntR family transcriptional regulator [Verrucomicrobiales bacterium]|jgi:GntR family transcriptional regulator|nr:GntR family transcriptional regulator [Verrucomicrobiales bacterium]